MVCESRQRSLRKSRFLWATIVTWLFHRITKFTPAQLVVLFCAILFLKFISMRAGLEEYTRENFLFMVGKWSRSTSFLSSPRQALKTKLCRQRDFQKPVPIVQNILVAYLIHVIQIVLFPEHLCKFSPSCIYAFGKNKW